jgi:hypothetical protein
MKIAFSASATENRTPASAMDSSTYPFGYGEARAIQPPARPGVILHKFKPLETREKETWVWPTLGLAQGLHISMHHSKRWQQ